MAEKASLLIIDDEPRLRELYAQLLEMEGYAITTASMGQEGLNQLKEHDFHLVLCDVKLPDIRGLDMLKRIKAAAPATEVILITAYGNIPDGVMAMKLGAFDYLTKGDSDDQIVVRVATAVEKALLVREVARLRLGQRSPFSFDDLIGRSEGFLATVQQARKVAPTDASVLLLGETGTGKELFAKAIHQASARNQGQMVSLNCAAIPREMLESELFGYRKGAFTGAAADKPGLLEIAAGGTLFLDEIGEMPLEMQAKLLRALDAGSFYPLGSTRPMIADVRIVAATHQPLRMQAESGHFRRDLYYRLSVFTLEIKPLRERPEDIPLLVVAFIRQYALLLRKGHLNPGEGFLAALVRYAWPGNVRELRNIMERSVILAEPDSTLHENLLPPDILELKIPYPDPEQLEPMSLESLELHQIRKVLTLTGGNRNQAAEMLGIGVATLYRKISRYGLE